MNAKQLFVARFVLSLSSIAAYATGTTYITDITANSFDPVAQEVLTNSDFETGDKLATIRASSGVIWGVPVEALTAVSPLRPESTSLSMSSRSRWRAAENRRN